MRVLSDWGGLKPLLLPMLGFSLVGFILYTLQAYELGGWGDWYLNWNLFLAWLPLLFAAGLVQVLKKHDWSDWRAIALTVLWLGFLPNSFYIITDFIHLPEARPDMLLFTAVLYGAYTLAGLLLGFASLALVRRELNKRMRPMLTLVTILFVLFLCSFAIYLGRDLRWNTWDIVVNPAGILFDVSDRLIQPQSHPKAFTTTATFWFFLSGLYIAGERLLIAVRLMAKR